MQHLEIHTRTEDTATVDGTLIHRGSYATIHDAAVAQVITHAQDEGRAVLARAIDGVGGGAVFWIRVTPDGGVQPAEPPVDLLAAPSIPHTPSGRHLDLDESDYYTPPQVPASAPVQPAGAYTFGDHFEPPASGDAQPTTVSAIAPEPETPSWAAPIQAIQEDPPVHGNGSPAAPTQDDPSPTTGPIRIQPPGDGRPASDQHREPYAPHRYQQQTRGQGRNPAGGPPPQGPWSMATVTPPPAELTTFLTDTTSRGPEPSGWNGFLRRLGFKTGPTDEQKRRWSDERAVSQHWAGPRTIAVVNGKGGSTKTPTTAMISAVFARYGGSGVCAWDANFTRGTLGWRTEQGPHGRTVLELVPHLDELRSPSANSADLAGYLHHQTQDKYDVLRSNPRLLKQQQMIRPEQQDGTHLLLTKHYRLVFIDSGNDEGDSVWLRMIDHADAIIVPVLNRLDHAEAAKELLGVLRDRDQRSARLADNAVVVVSHGDSNADAIPPTQLVPGLSQLAREVVTIPNDSALSALWLRYDNLQPSTQRAWLRAAAAVAEGLSHGAGQHQ